MTSSLYHACVRLSAPAFPHVHQRRGQHPRQPHSCLRRSRQAEKFHRVRRAEKGTYPVSQTEGMGATRYRVGKGDKCAEGFCACASPISISLVLTPFVPQPIFGCSSRSFIPFPNQDIGFGSPPSAIPFPCVEEEGEEEPYVIYSSSPNSSLSSLSEEITPVLPLNSGPSPSLGLPVAGAPQPLQRRSSSHHRRCSSASLRGHTRKQSLSSICEVPEED